jgi:hypothetical protein
MGNIIYSRQQIVTGSTSIAGMNPQGTRSTDFTATANSIYDITASCKMTLPSNPSIGDRVAFILATNALFDITAPDKIDGKILAVDFAKRVQVTGVWFVWTYSGSTNGWTWNSIYTSSIGEVYAGTGDVVLYLKFDEATPIDSSVNPKPLTIVGTSQNTDDKKIGTSSRSFAQSNSYINTNHSDLALGTGNFTIESWVKYSVVSSNSGWFQIGASALLGSSSNAGPVNMKRQNGIKGQVEGINFADIDTTFTPINIWHHLALTRSGNTFTIWVNGVARSTLIRAYNITGTFWAIGAFNSSSNCWNGLIDSFRITKGIARYTISFNPETDTGLV